jgi:hypothetical protein
MSTKLSRLFNTPPTVAGASEAFTKVLSDLKAVSEYHSQAAKEHYADAQASLTLHRTSVSESSAAHEIGTKLAAIISPTTQK